MTSPLNCIENASRALRRALACELAEIGLHPGQDRMLVALLERPQCCNAVADALGIAEPTVTKTAKRLRNHGLLRISTSEADRRRHLLILTEAGEMLALKVVAIRAEIDTAAMAVIQAARGDIFAQLSALERSFAPKERTP